MLIPWKESYDIPRQYIKKQRRYFANKGPTSQGYGFSSSHIWVWELDYKESCVSKNVCFWTVVPEKTLESPLDQGDPTSPSWRRSGLGVHWKDWCWSWNFNTLATWCEELTHLKRPRSWERLRAGREGDNRGWGGWMASPTQWRWVWVDSGSWRAAVHAVTKSRTWLSDWTELILSTLSLSLLHHLLPVNLLLA